MEVTKNYMFEFSVRKHMIKKNIAKITLNVIILYYFILLKILI